MLISAAAPASHLRQTPGKREFVPRDQVSSLLVVYCSLSLHINQVQVHLFTLIQLQYNNNKRSKNRANYTLN